MKELLNMRRKGLSQEDTHNRLLKLQEENERLKKTHIAINEVENLIKENRQMKIELQKVSASSTQQSNSFNLNQERAEENTEKESFEDEDYDLLKKPAILIDTNEIQISESPAKLKESNLKPQTLNSYVNGKVKMEDKAVDSMERDPVKMDAHS